ncbi:MAG: DUF2281 domain-containing protein [Saprospiraceae bacterium]|nr:DUF2281 domain-containing protein [Saprospiraceae bacterium]
MTDQIIITQLQQLPESLKKEVMDFIGFLLEKHQLGSQSPKPRKNRGKGEQANDEVAEALKIIQDGCDMSSFGDALSFQNETRKERKLPHRD